MMLRLTQIDLQALANNDLVRRPRGVRLISLPAILGHQSDRSNAANCVRPARASQGETYGALSYFFEPYNTGSETPIKTI